MFGDRIALANCYFIQWEIAEPLKSPRPQRKNNITEVSTENAFNFSCGFNRV